VDVVGGALITALILLLQGRKKNKITTGYKIMLTLLKIINYARNTNYSDQHTKWRKPGAEFGGTEKIFADQGDFFLKKLPFSGKNF